MGRYKQICTQQELYECAFGGPHLVISQIVNYLGQIRLEVKWDKQTLTKCLHTCLPSKFCLFLEQNVD